MTEAKAGGSTPGGAAHGGPVRVGQKASPPATGDNSPEGNPAQMPSGTRDRILRMAIAEFAEKGYSGARIDTVCKKARANPRMIYHYFGGKDHLYIAVLEQVLGELRGEELKLDVAHVPPLEGLMQLFDFTYDHFGAHPELINLLSGENLLRAQFLRQSVKTPIVASPLIKLLGQLLRRGERTGDFRQGIDPLQLYVIMVGLAYFHRSNAHTLSVIFESHLSDADWQAEHRRYAKDMILRFLRRERR